MSYDFYSAMEETMGVGMMIFYGIYMLVMLGIGIAAYVLRAAGMYSIAKRRGITNAWFSWIPVLNLWVLGCISDQYQYVVKGKNKSKRKWLLTLNVVMAVLYVVFLVCIGAMAFNSVTGALNNAGDEAIAMAIMGPMMGMLGLSIPIMGVAIAVAIMRYIALYDLYSSCNPRYNVVFLVLSILFNVTEPFFIFFNRKKDGGMPPRRVTTQPEPQPVRFEQPRDPWDNVQE
jgi:hypothetical protein